MFSHLSLKIKYSLIFLVTALLVAAAMLVSLQYFKTQVLRNEARAVASQVVSFRAWVANSGMIWVDSLSKDFHDFLSKRPDADGNNYFGKNPALATRELSQIANKSAIRATFRVTSDEYRHESNAPDAFESSAIQSFKSGGPKYYEGYENETYRYAQPIYVKKACLKCHGEPENAPKEVIEKYGDQKAFGYKEGDVRGIISVQLPDLAMTDIARALLNPFTIGLIVLAFVLNWLFTSRGLIRRLRKLTEDTEAISKGQLGRELDFESPKDSHDEVDHVANAVNLLRNSLRVAMKHMEND